MLIHLLTLLGTKNVAKGMRKITVGPKKSEGKTWFSQLSDKSKLLYMFTQNDHINFLLDVGKSVKTSLYWAMKNCSGDAKYLRELIMNISKHYQVCFLFSLIPRLVPVIKATKGALGRCYFTYM